MSKCRRCNRNLKREPWATKGIGKICEQKENRRTGSNQKEYDSDMIMPYDGGDIWIERIASLTTDDRGQLTLMKHACSGIKTNVQRKEYDHSPTGFNFGYAGSGPADFALNVLLMFTDRETAHRLHQPFKWKYVATGDSEKLVIPKSEILKFIEENKEVLI